MKYIRFAFASSLVALMFSVVPAQTAAQSTQIVLHYKDVVGTYETREGDAIRIERAPGGLIRISISAVYPYRTSDGKMTANTGEAQGTTKLVGDTALFKPDNTERCTIKLVFKPSKIIVKQDGADSECGFGHNVTADGTYTLKSRRVQRFDETGAPVKPKRRT